MISFTSRKKLWHFLEYWPFFFFFEVDLKNGKKKKGKRIRSTIKERTITDFLQKTRIISKSGFSEKVVLIRQNEIWVFTKSPSTRL